MNKVNSSVRAIFDSQEIWFVAEDVASALCYEDFDIVPEKCTGYKQVDGQAMLCLSEEGMYFVLGRSDKEELTTKKAQILQGMIDNPDLPFTCEQRGVIAHEVLRLITCREYPELLSKSEDRFYTASEIGEAVGITDAQVLRVANAYNLLPPAGERNKYGRWLSAGNFLYTGVAFEWFREYIKEDER